MWWRVLGLPSSGSRVLEALELRISEEIKLELELLDQRYDRLCSRPKACKIIRWQLNGPLSTKGEMEESGSFRFNAGSHYLVRDWEWVQSSSMMQIAPRGITLFRPKLRLPPPLELW